MEAPTAWVLNLDADLELAAPHRYAPTKTVRAAMTAMAHRVAPLLLGPDDRLVDEDTPPNATRGWPGRAFCPTPRALAVLARAGAVAAPAPPVEVLRLVNSRAFAARIGPLLPHAAFVEGRDVANAMLAASPGAFAAWRVKRQHGMAGRQQRVIAPAARLSAGDDAFVRAGISEGGVQIEPNVSIVAEWGKHGVVAAAGAALRLGLLVRQRCDARGVWLASEAATRPTDEERAIDRALDAKASEVAAALAAAGYAGPFGIDAFTYRAEDGAVRLHVLGEINARYTMGFGLGFPR